MMNQDSDDDVTACEECNAAIPQDAHSHLGNWHMEACSLFQQEYVWTVKIRIAPQWVADGIDLGDPRQLGRLLERAYPHLTSHEAIATLVSEPDPETVAREQGYTSAAHMRGARKR